MEQRAKKYVVCLSHKYGQFKYGRLYELNTDTDEILTSNGSPSAIYMDEEIDEAHDERDPVPWRYATAEEMVDFLSGKPPVEVSTSFPTTRAAKIRELEETLNRLKEEERQKAIAQETRHFTLGRGYSISIKNGVITDNRMCNYPLHIIKNLITSVKNLGSYSNINHTSVNVTAATLRFGCEEGPFVTIQQLEQFVQVAENQLKAK